MTVRSFGGPIPPYPSGTILAWSKPVNKIPRGWLICDGFNGTPNLLDKFPRSIPDSTTDPGGDGGQNSKTLMENQLPVHSHDLVIDEGGRHNHAIDRDSASAPDISGDHFAQYNNNIDSSIDGEHSHTFSTDVDGGGGESVENQPRHRETIFIQKT